MLRIILAILAVALCVQACSPVMSCASMQALVKAHFSPQYYNDMLCIAYYESSYCPTVYNGICCWGLWQINSNHLGEPGCPTSTSGLQNPDTNAECAAHVLATQGLNAWTTYASGDCRSWSHCTMEADNMNATLAH